jgi:hypothetical protein
VVPAVTVPAEWAGSRVLLHFGAVDHDTTVWVNGTEVARHRGGFTPFTADLHGVAEPGSERRSWSGRGTPGTGRSHPSVIGWCPLSTRRRCPRPSSQRCPLVVVFMFFQRGIVKSVATTGRAGSEPARPATVATPRAQLPSR